MMNFINKLFSTKQNKTIAINVIGAFAIKGASLIISIFLLPLYIKFFNNQTVLGIWYTILSMLNWISLFDLGLGNGLRNKLPSALHVKDMKSAKEYISTTYFTMLVFATILFCFGMILIPKLNLYNLFNIDNNSIEYASLLKSVMIVFAGIIMQLILKIITSVLYAIQRSAIVNLLILLSNAIILVALMFFPSRTIEENLITMSWLNVLATNVPYLFCTIVLFFGVLKSMKPSIRAFRRRYVKEIFSVGLSLLWLQLVFMMVSSTNEFLISNMTEPQYVVEYQAYYKIFKTAAILVSLALTPIWSAVTKAQVEKNYSWIKRVYQIFLGISALCFVIELCLIPLLQWIMDLWLGDGVITVSIVNSFVFVLSSVTFVLHNVNTSIGNGLSYFSVQMIWMTVAAVLFVPLSWLLVNIFGNWIGVVLAGVLSMAPYEILAPIYTMRLLKREIESLRS